MIHHIGMAAQNQIRLKPLQVLGRIDISFLKDGAVAGDYAFVAVLVGIVGIGKNVVAGEGDAPAVDRAVKTAAGIPSGPGIQSTVNS